MKWPCSIILACAAKNDDSECDFFGTAGTDDEHDQHEIYAKVQGKSTKTPCLEVTCINDCGDVSRTDTTGYPDGTVIVPVNVWQVQDEGCGGSVTGP